MKALLAGIALIVASLSLAATGNAQTVGTLTGPDDMIVGGYTPVTFTVTTTSTTVGIPGVSPFELVDCAVYAANGDFVSSAGNGPDSPTLFYDQVFFPSDSPYTVVCRDAFSTLTFHVTVIEPSGACSDSFLLAYAPGDKSDRNGDGYICTKNRAETDNKH